MSATPFYIRIPSTILTMAISPTAKIVWGYIRYRQYENETAWPSHRRMANELRVARSTIVRAIEDLENAGLIDVIRPEARGRGRYWKYTIKGIETNLLNGSKTNPLGPEKVAKRSLKRRVLLPETEEGEKSSSCAPVFVPPTLDEVMDYATSNGFPKSNAEDFYRWYDASDWKRKDGKPVQNWKHSFLQWMKRDKTNGNTTASSDPPGPSDEQSRAALQGMTVNS